MFSSTLTRAARFVAVAVAVAMLPNAANAVSFRDAMFLRSTYAAFSFGVSDDSGQSGVFQQIGTSGLTDGNVYGFGSFEGLNDSWQFVAEIAGYSDTNTLGVHDGAVYTPFVLGGNTAGDSGVANFGAGTYTLTAGSIGSPTGFWSANDAANSDGAAHLIGLRVTTGGVVSFPGFAGATVPSVTLQAGDIIVALEDKAVGAPWDKDYNDLVVVMRQVPEPSTMVLLGSGLVAGLMRRRRAAA